MKRLCLLFALLMLVTFIGMACQPSAHDRYRQMTYRRAMDADCLGFQDDADADLLNERPTHLSSWYNQ